MQGYVGLTDFDWWTFLSRQPQLEEVNFWKPSGGAFKALSPCEPFFFKLKKQFGNVIVGLGFFCRFDTMTIQDAWSYFGVSNGAAALSDVRSQIVRYLTSRRDGEARLSHHHIGCTLLISPVFFSEDRWVEGPRDWKDNIVSGKGYDLGQGEGLRIWRACQENMAKISAGLPAASRDNLQLLSTARYGKEQVVRPRLGQGTFRLAVMDAYGRCAVTGEHSRPALDAAHIKPFAEDGPHSINNGLLLRADVHRLFDRGYVTVNPDYSFQVSGRLQEEFKNGKIYYEMAGKKIILPDDVALRPNRDFLDYHSQSVFLP